MVKWTTLLLLLAWVGGAAAGGEIRVRNAGTPGHTTRRALASVCTDVLAYRPEWTIVALGTNDASYWIARVELDEYEDNLERLVDILQEGGVEHIVLCTPPPLLERYLRKHQPAIPDGIDFMKRLADYAEAARRVARKRDMILFDIHALVEENGGATEAEASPVRNLANSDSLDGLHFSPDGHELLARALYDRIKGEVRPGETIVCFGDSNTYGANLPNAGTTSGSNWPSHLWKWMNPGLAAPSPVEPVSICPPARVGAAGQMDRE